MTYCKLWFLKMKHKNLGDLFESLVQEVVFFLFRKVLPLTWRVCSFWGRHWSYDVKNEKKSKMIPAKRTQPVGEVKGSPSTLWGWTWAHLQQQKLSYCWKYFQEMANLRIYHVEDVPEEITFIEGKPVTQMSWCELMISWLLGFI